LWDNGFVREIKEDQMPIIHMTFGTEAEAQATMEKFGGYNLRPCEGKYYLYDTHQGLCLREFERNGYNDSDFYMVVWNPATKTPETIEFATTRGWSYPCFGSKVDATPEVIAEYEAYLEKQRKAAELAQDKEQARQPKFGRTVKVVKGRKVPVGTTGEICWVGVNQFAHQSYYAPSKKSLRVGIRLLDGTKVFTDFANCEIVNPQQYETLKEAA
jgi:hypothetical protein